jgi:ATP-dependent protease ClpP protease subunit
MSDPKRRNISQRSEMIYDVHNFGIILDTREIFLGSNLDESQEDSQIDHVVANTFIRNLQILNNMSDDAILVHMITCGGDWNYGMAIYDAIKQSCDDPKLSDVVVLAYAHARSMSSVIPQAASYRVIMPNADFLVHWGTEVADGNYTSVQAETKWSAVLAERMVDVYYQRCKDGDYWRRHDILTEQDIKQFLRENMDKKQEWYMAPRTAVDMGFMDAVLGDEHYETIASLREE